ncbi:MAG: hypothetical protein EP343_13625 [Deltaproteobacteria bacterium]|nr:MAG: hypothetical protein EP343_13625 [Deltaproteobacteria bacterium]
MSELKHESLSAMLEDDPGRRAQVVQDAVVVLDQEVSSKRGAVGLLIKGGFKVIKNLRGGKMVESLIDFLLDEFVEALDPYYQSYKEQDAGSRGTFTSYLSARDAEVAEALLSVTDARRQRASTKVLIKTYDRLRPTALKHVQEGVPAVGRLMEKHIHQ